MKNFHFIPVEDLKTLDKLIKWVRPQGLDYPNWDIWIDKTYFEILNGYKQAIILEVNGNVMGDAISQPHKENGLLYEFKNLRVNSELWDFGCGYFLAKQVEKYARKNFHGIICDLRSSEKNVYSFLLRIGYVPLGERFLYDECNPDTIMIKTFDKKTEAGIIYKSKELILGN